MLHRRLPIGCVVGPLVVAGVSIDQEVVSDLKELGVRDSKKLTPRQRESLYPEILKVSARVCSFHIPPSEIDQVVRAAKKYRKLNYLEAQYMARVIDQLSASRVVVDASDTVPSRFRANIWDNLVTKSAVAAHHHADRDYPVVAAASIVAKVERDGAVAKLRRLHGDFGSGYPSDPKTRVFFSEWLRRDEELPSFVRRSWKTWERLRQALVDSH